MRRSGVLLSGLLLILITGCRHVEPLYSEAPVSNQFSDPSPAAVMSPVALGKPLDPSWLQPPKDLFTLGPGDKVELELIGEPASKMTTVVAPDGKIYFNLLPGIDVWGLTIAQAKQRFEGALYPKYVKQPLQVSIVLRAV